MRCSLDPPKMESPETNWQRSVPLNGAADNLPLKDAVICCTSVPDEKRVGFPQASRKALEPMLIYMTTDGNRSVCQTDGCHSSIRFDPRCYTPHRWSLRYPEIQICCKGTARCDAYDDRMDRKLERVMDE